MILTCCVVTRSLLHNGAAMDGIRKCDFRTPGLFSRSSFQIHIILALSFWIPHVLSDVPVSNLPTPMPVNNTPASAPYSSSPPAPPIHPPEPLQSPHPLANAPSGPPPPPAPDAIPPAPDAIPPVSDAFPPASSPPLSETSTPPTQSVVQVAATNNSWNDSEKAGVIIASIGALLQVFVVAYLLVKRHQMLAMVQEYDTPEHCYKEIQPA